MPGICYIIKSYIVKTLVLIGFLGWKVHKTKRIQRLR